jgi:hypothetical protein
MMSKKHAHIGGQGCGLSAREIDKNSDARILSKPLDWPTGKEQWQEWHHDFFHNQKEGYVQDDVETHALADKMNTDLEVITLRETKQTALEVSSRAEPTLVT